MKRFFLSVCFAAFLSAGLVSCADEAAEITPQNELVSPEYATTDEESGHMKPSRP